MLKLPYDPVRLNIMSRDKIAPLAFGMLDTVQAERIEEQAMAAALAFFTYAQKLRIDPQELYNKAARMYEAQPFHHVGNTTLEAFDDFLGFKKRGQL